MANEGKDIVGEHSEAGKPLDAGLASILQSIRDTLGESESPAIGALQPPDPATDPAPSRPAHPRTDTSATIETFLATLVEPHLKAWLAANLPEIVQKAVREELGRLIGATDPGSTEKEDG